MRILLSPSLYCCCDDPGVAEVVLRRDRSYGHKASTLSHDVLWVSHSFCCTCTLACWELYTFKDGVHAYFHFSAEFMSHRSSHMLLKSHSRTCAHIGLVMVYAGVTHFLVTWIPNSTNPRTTVWWIWSALDINQNSWFLVATEYQSLGPIYFFD